MAAFVYDSSAIVKRQLAEVGSAWVRSLTDSQAGHRTVLTRITRVEVIAAVARRARGRNLPGSSATAVIAQFRHEASNQFKMLEITPALLTEAERLAELHGLRGYDAVQLAAAVTLHQIRSAAGMSNLTFISADGQLNIAAQAEGMIVDDPNNHP